MLTISIIKLALIIDISKPKLNPARIKTTHNINSMPNQKYPPVWLLADCNNPVAFVTVLKSTPTNFSPSLL